MRSDGCSHVAEDATMVVATRGPGQVAVRCPCCGLNAWRERNDDLDGDECPYCGVRAQRVDVLPSRTEVNA